LFKFFLIFSDKFNSLLLLLFFFFINFDLFKIEIVELYFFNILLLFFESSFFIFVFDIFSFIELLLFFFSLNFKKEINFLLLLFLFLLNKFIQ